MLWVRFNPKSNYWARICVVSLISLFSNSCAIEGEKVSLVMPFDFENPFCLEPAGWIPSIPGAGTHQNDPTVSFLTTTHAGSAPLVGLDQSYGGSQELVFQFDVSSDLGDSGSISLDGQTTSFPGELQGSAYPFLISLVDHLSLIHI